MEDFQAETDGSIADGEITPRVAASGEKDPEWRLFPLDGYQVASDPSIESVSLWPPTDIEKRTKSFFEKGMRNTAVAVILTHRWLIPHFLMVIKKPTNTPATATASSGGDPGDNGANRVINSKQAGLFSCKYKPDQGPVSALEAKLRPFLRDSTKSGPPNMTGSSGAASDLVSPAAVGPACYKVAHHLGTLWVAGPNDYDNAWPQIPAHVTRPRERIRLYQVCLSPQVTFHLPPDYTIKSVPLTDPTPKFLNIPYALEQLPFLTSRFVFTYFAEGGEEEDQTEPHHHRVTG